MAMLSVFVEVFLVFTLFLRPGIALTVRFFPSFPLGQRLALALLSALLCSMFWQMATRALLPAWAVGFSGISWALLALIAPCLAKKQNVIMAVIFTASASEKRGLLLCVFVTAIWLALLPLSPYPAQPLLGLGDAPAYYVAARNLARGLPMRHGHFTGDYIGGYLAYIKAQPLLVYACAQVIQLTGFSLTALHVLLLISGGLALCAAAELAVGERQDCSRLPFVVAIFILLPGHFLLLGAGQLAAPAILAAVVFCAVALSERIPFFSRSLALAICGSAMMLSRPESAILAGSLFGCILFREIWRISAMKKAVLLFALLMMSYISIAHLPHLSDWIGGPMENLGIFHLHFEPRYKQFTSAPLWWQNNRSFCALAFTDSQPKSTPANTRILADICAHPSAFAAYCAQQLWSRSSFIIRAVLGPLWPPLSLSWSRANTISCFLWLTLLLCAAMACKHLPLIVGISLFMLTLPPLNPGVSDRHWMVATFLLVALAVRAALQTKKSMNCETGSDSQTNDIVASMSYRHPLSFFICFSLCLLVETVWLAQTLLIDNTQYVPTIEAIKRYVPERATVVCSWPPIIACCTGRDALGCTWLTENLAAIVAKHHPQWLIIDSATERPDNYEWFMWETGGHLDGYEIVEHNPGDRYIILRRLKQQNKKVLLENRPAEEIGHASGR